MLAPEGYGIIATVTGLAIAAILLSLLGGLAIRIPVVVLASAAILFTLYFFRDPERTITADEGLTLIAPADGKVIEIVDVDHEPLYLNSPATRISIFLSPLNVHVNRAPATGQIEYVNYVPGEYLVAWHEKASEKNERSEIGLMHSTGSKVLFKQIAGAVARRIVYHLDVGDSVVAGDRFGIVKFGSRMDVIVPRGSNFVVTPGEKVTAGVTILGSLPQVQVGGRNHE